LVLVAFLFFQVDPKVTMRYAHLSTKALQEAANAGSVIVPKAQPAAATEPAGAVLAEPGATAGEQETPKLIPVTNVVRLFPKAA
jgi:hypothetical protein